MTWTKVARFMIGFAGYFLLSAILGCSNTTGPSDPEFRPQFQKVAGAPDGGGGGGGGASGGGLTRDERAICTLAGTNNDVECSKLLLKLMTGGLGGGVACLRGNLEMCGALYGWGTDAMMDWKNHPDPFYQPWFENNVWPPGVGGTYPVPIGGY